jgi:tetratricopeptide (TPR) repeat protein
MFEYFNKILQHPLVDSIAKTIKKFKSSKSYYSVSYMILFFTFREAIAWKFGSAIKTFCETQAQDATYPVLWDVVGFFFDVGGSWELVALGASFFLILSFVKVKASETDEVITVVKDEAKKNHEQLEEIKKLIKLQGGDETEFLKKYFGDDYLSILENPQTYHNLKTKLLNSSTSIEELIEEKETLVKKIESQSLNASVQKLVDQAFAELRYEDVRTLLDEFIEKNQNIGDDLIKAHYQKALAYIEEIEYFKAKEEFESFIPMGIKDAEILHEYGSLYYTLGEYDKLLECNTNALALNIKEFGENDSFVATDYNEIGLAWDSKGEYDKAIEFYNKDLKIRLATLGENHPSTASSYNNIGAAWRSKGEHDKAIEFYNKSLKIFIDVLGENHPNVEVVRGNLKMAEEKLMEHR